MSLHKTQLGPAEAYPFTRYRRCMKRQMTRLERRLARRDPENAPKKHRYRGYDL